MVKFGKKLKNIIPIETRISLYQTAMNNAGRNFQGKRVKVSKMAEFTAAFYKVAVKDVENIGELNIQQIEKTLGRSPTIKVTKKKDVVTLMNKVKKNGGGR